MNTATNESNVDASEPVTLNNVTSDIEEIDVDPDPESGEVETAAAKRHRISPRTKAFDEALALALTYTKEWADDAGDPTVKDALVASFEHFVEKLTEVRDQGVAKLAYGGRHYVRVYADGMREQFQANNPPTKRNQGEKVSGVLGPFRTKDGALYAVKHLDHMTKVVF